MSDTGSGHRPPIVVGVDGSAGAVQALRWAARQARYDGATLEAVTTDRLARRGPRAQGVVRRDQGLVRRE